MTAKPRAGKFTNEIGDYGEHLAMTSFSKPVGHQYERPLFRATPLGGKYPVVDLLIDILDPNSNSTGFFFAQIKATSGEKKPSKRLRIKTDLKKYNLLASIPIPTYLVGVDTVHAKVYLVAAHQPLTKRVSSITKSFDLSLDAIRISLYEEVGNFWIEMRKRVSKSNTEFKHDR